VFNDKFQIIYLEKEIVGNLLWASLFQKDFGAKSPGSNKNAIIK